MKKKSFLVTLVFVLMVMFLSSVLLVAKDWSPLSLQMATVTLESGEVLFVETANTPAQKTKGLSGTKKVPRDGLLFIYKTPEDVGIWMKDMKYSIDIVWIANGEVVYLVEGAEPDDAPDREVYHAGVLVDYVLELESGKIQELKIGRGDSIEIKE